MGQDQEGGRNITRAFGGQWRSRPRRAFQWLMEQLAPGVVTGTGLPGVLALNHLSLPDLVQNKTLHGYLWPGFEYQRAGLLATLISSMLRHTSIRARRARTWRCVVNPSH